MDGAALIAVHGAGCRVLDSLDVRQLPGLLVILNAVRWSDLVITILGALVLPFANLEVQRAPQSIVEVGKELGLEHAVKKGIGFLSPDHQ